jgi:hypothetical protein
MRVTPEAFCGKGPESQTEPESLVLAPTHTYGDTYGQGAGKVGPCRIQGKQGRPIAGESFYVLTSSQLAPGGCHQRSDSDAVPLSSRLKSPPGKEEQENQSC